MPILRVGPKLRKSRQPRSVTSIRRSGRLAVKPRAANATLQAQSVLMQKLGLPVDSEPQDPEAFEKYHATFAAPLSPNKQGALQLLFSNEFDPVAIELNLAELQGVDM